MSESRRLQFTPDLEICRILNGMWQVSGAHGSIAPQKAIPSMFSYLDAGFTTWDLADHYGPAEDFIGEFRRQLVAQRGIDALNNLQAFTKWVPRPGKMTKEIVEKNIAISLRRMDVDSLDLLQFHWWDYRDKNYLDALYFLGELQQEGKIKHLALTNFDTEHLKIILSAGIKIVSNQVQFSLIGKYKNMINAWGNWQLFQELLTVLKAIADSYHVTIPNVAVRYVLEQKAVAGAIIGVRLGVAEHIQENARIFDFQLSPQDYQKIDHVLQKSRDLLQLIGDCGDEYRR